MWDYIVVLRSSIRRFSHFHAHQRTRVTKIFSFLSFGSPQGVKFTPLMLAEENLRKFVLHVKIFVLNIQRFSNSFVELDGDGISPRNSSHHLEHLEIERRSRCAPLPDFRLSLEIHKANRGAEPARDVRNCSIMQHELSNCYLSGKINLLNTTLSEKGIRFQDR